MKQMMKPLIFAGLVGSFVIGLTISADHDGVVAQRRTSVKVTHVFTGPDGNSRSEVIDMKVAGEAGTENSDVIPVTGMRFQRQAPGYFSDFHPAPRKQYVITLSGQGSVELSGGEKLVGKPGDVWLMDDVTGKGHISRGVGSEDRVTLFIPVPEK